MFWKFNLMTSSHVDTLLEKEDVTLQELMDEDDILQECKAQNRKLIDFLIREDNMEEMVKLITEEPSSDADEKNRYKYPNTACELLTSDVSQINDKLADDQTLIDKLYGFLESEKPLNPLLASFFSKVMGLLITRKSQMIFDYLKAKDDFVRTLMYHLGTSAIMDLLLRLITCIDSPEVRTAMINWLNEQNIVDKLVARIIPSEDEEVHYNASQSLCDIIKLSRDLMSQLQERADADPLLAAIESEEMVSKLLSNMLDGEKDESCIVSGLSVVQTLLEFRKQGLDSGLDQITALDAERLAQGVTNVLQAIKPRLKDFHNILLDPPKQKYSRMPTTVGVMDPPLGNTRLQIVRLLTTLVSTNTHSINQELSSLGTIRVLLDLFFKYIWNNFLHTQVEQCVNTILTNPPAQVEGRTENPLLSQLLTDCTLLQRIVDGWEQNDEVQTKNGGHRQGYMGHLTCIANDVLCCLEKGENATLLKESYEGVPEESRQQWESFVASALTEMNKKNTVELVPNHTIPSSSEDDDADFRDIPFPQDTAMQQAFSDYQLQQMTSNFIDQFGFNEEEFAEQEEKVDLTFTDRISTIDFNIQANEDDEQPGSTMFEQRCNENIQPFDDNDSDEDIWEEKPFTVASGTGDSSSPIKRETNADSDDSTDSEDELSSPKIIPQQPSTEKMEIDSTEVGWAKFDSSIEIPPVAMDMGNPWESSASRNTTANTSAVSENTQAADNWADFSKFAPSTDPGPRSSSPVAMDTTENNSRSSAYLAASAPADLANEVSEASEGDSKTKRSSATEDGLGQKAMSPDSTTVEPTVPPSGSGDSSNPKLAEEVPVVEGSAVPGDTQVTSTNESGLAQSSYSDNDDDDDLNSNFAFLAASGLMKSKATSSQPALDDNKAEPSENSSREKEGQLESGTAMEQLRAQAKDAMEQYDKATTMTSTTTIQLQNGPV
ncbi:serine/threonine-protein phosphatase 6 regulatory subunit 3-like isoform X3 [Liolophura sinensis]|uniref:serine/threonine-protein phosphatase 6 regulatory subunit 3-like isoform X3 n=1 Tax=Liolophura sinensis TaxID=3198878 RepID=UPI0031598B6D